MPGGNKNIKPEDCTNGFDKNPQNINRTGRPKGLRNRSTIAKEILELTVKYPKDILEKLKEIYPGIKDGISFEEAITVVQASKALVEKDTTAYKALLDSRYGSPIQEIKQENTNIEMTEEEKKKLVKKIKDADK